MITTAFKTTSHEALCILAGSTPIFIKLAEIAKYHNIISGRAGLLRETAGLDIAINHKNWPHPAENPTIEAKIES